LILGLLPIKGKPQRFEPATSLHWQRVYNAYLRSMSIL
jgi:hypothetical protein